MADRRIVSRALGLVAAVALVAAALAAVAYAGRTDQALVDRVADLERSQDRLRATLVDLGAPDPDEQAAREQTAAQVRAVRDRIAELEGTAAALRADLDEGSLGTDDRLTALELQLEELRTTVTALDGALTTLTDRTSSLEVQFDSHRDDPTGHTGNDGSSP